MEQHSKIIDYSVEWRDKLRRYMINRFPIHSEAYIGYCLDHSTDRIPSKLVINDNDDVVGCHLYYCTKVLVKGVEVETHWGHDTFLDKEYRAERGLDLMLSINSVKDGFGLGLTDINSKLQKKLRNIFFEGVYTYYMISWKAFLSPFQKYFGDHSALYKKEDLKVGKHVFRRIDDAETMTIPNNGYWFNGSRDIDFIRDASFLNQRFVKNKVHKYYLYACKENDDICYFVVRKVMFKGFPALTLSDFRYTNPKMVPLILRAVKKYAAQSQLGIILFICGDKNIDKNMEGKLHYRKDNNIFIGYRGLTSDMSYCITGADADADFLK